MVVHLRAVERTQLFVQLRRQPREIAGRRVLARLHGVGARARFRRRGAIDTDTFIREPARAALASGLLPERLHDAWRSRTGAIATVIAMAISSIIPG